MKKVIHIRMADQAAEWFLLDIGHQESVQVALIQPLFNHLEGARRCGGGLVNVRIGVD